MLVREATRTLSREGCYNGQRGSISFGQPGPHSSKFWRTVPDLGRCYGGGRREHKYGGSCPWLYGRGLVGRKTTMGSSMGAQRRFVGKKT